MIVAVGAPMGTCDGALGSAIVDRMREGPRFRVICFVASLLCILALANCKRGKGASALRPCRLPGIDEGVLCGKLTVFENRATRVGRTIDRNVVVMPAFGPKNKTEPLFELAGGPGVAATGAAGFYANEGKEYRRQHDIV